MSEAKPSVNFPDVGLLGDAAAQEYVRVAYELMDSYAERARYFLQEKVDEELVQGLTACLGIENTYSIPRVSYEATCPLFRKTPKYKKGVVVPTAEDGQYFPAGLPERVLSPFPEIADKVNVRAFYDAYMSSVGRASLLSELERSRTQLKEFTENEEAGWEQAAEYSTGHTYVRNYEGSNLKSFKVVGLANVPLMDQFPVIYEPECYPQWFPFMKRSTEIAAFTRFHKIIHSEVSCPWPITNRDLVLEATGIDDTARGRVIINIRDLSPESEHFIPEKDLVRASMPLGGYMLELISPNLTRISFYCHVDAKLYMPAWLLNFTTGKLMNRIVSNIEDMATKVRKPKSVYLPYIEKHKQIYSDVEDIVKHCFQSEEEELKTA